MRAFNDDLASIPYNESQHAKDYESYYHSHIHMLHYIPLKTSNDQVIRNLIQESIEQIFKNKYYAYHMEFHDKSLYAVGCVFSTGTQKICGVGIQEFTYRLNKLEKMELQNFLDEFS
ncbi:13708_t:CDS:2 [Funneliformis mosseae]|uniref:13708_t:CDS:1 n=1 Tax=Funneliformis mosseae TaxID=27381 RepID=A0A9N9H839_FUNMO|nr:13708_t:CDS:2 [Funneliformis mosseae]